MENKLTKGSNVLWESSRMMLPEHKALLHQHEAAKDKKQKPNYDDQLLTQLVYQIEFAFHEHRVIRLTYYEDEAYHQYSGRITWINRDKQQIQVEMATRTMTFVFSEIISIESDGAD